MKTFIVYTIAYEDKVMYVGKTSDMANRKSKHKCQRGTCSSAIPVDADLSKIEFNVVAEFDNKDDALKYEDQLILQYNTINNGWNTRRSGLVYSDREYILAQKREYNEAHKEEIHTYRAAHREERAAYDREYNQIHKEERTAYKRDYRARKKAEAIASAS